MTSAKIEKINSLLSRFQETIEKSSDPLVNTTTGIYLCNVAKAKSVVPQDKTPLSPSQLKPNGYARSNGTCDDGNYQSAETDCPSMSTITNNETNNDSFWNSETSFFAPSGQNLLRDSNENEEELFDLGLLRVPDKDSAEKCFLQASERSFYSNSSSKPNLDIPRSFLSVEMDESKDIEKRRLGNPEQNRRGSNNCGKTQSRRGSNNCEKPRSRRGSNNCDKPPAGSKTARIVSIDSTSQHLGKSGSVHSSTSNRSGTQSSDNTSDQEPLPRSRLSRQSSLNSDSSNARRRSNNNESSALELHTNIERTEKERQPRSRLSRQSSQNNHSSSNLSSANDDQLPVFQTNDDSNNEDRHPRSLLSRQSSLNKRSSDNEAPANDQNFIQTDGDTTDKERQPKNRQSRQLCSNVLRRRRSTNNVSSANDHHELPQISDAIFDRNDRNCRYVEENDMENQQSSPKVDTNTSSECRHSSNPGFFSKDQQLRKASDNKSTGRLVRNSRQARKSDESDVRGGRKDRSAGGDGEVCASPGFDFGESTKPVRKLLSSSIHKINKNVPHITSTSDEDCTFPSSLSLETIARKSEFIASMKGRNAPIKTSSEHMLPHAPIDIKVGLPLPDFDHFNSDQSLAKVTTKSEFIAARKSRDAPLKTSSDHRLRQVPVDSKTMLRLPEGSSFNPGQHFVGVTTKRDFLDARKGRAAPLKSSSDHELRPAPYDSTLSDLDALNKISDHKLRASPIDTKPSSALFDVDPRKTKSEQRIRPESNPSTSLSSIHLNSSNAKKVTDDSSCMCIVTSVSEYKKDIKYDTDEDEDDGEDIFRISLVATKKGVPVMLGISNGSEFTNTSSKDCDSKVRDNNPRRKSEVPRRHGRSNLTHGRNVGVEKDLNPHGSASTDKNNSDNNRRRKSEIEASHGRSVLSSGNKIGLDEDDNVIDKRPTCTLSKNLFDVETFKALDYNEEDDDEDKIDFADFIKKEETEKAAARRKKLREDLKREHGGTHS